MDDDTHRKPLERIKQRPKLSNSCFSSALMRLRLSISSLLGEVAARIPLPVRSAMSLMETSPRFRNSAVNLPAWKGRRRLYTNEVIPKRSSAVV